MESYRNLTGVTSHLHQVFFDFARISYFKFLEFKEFNKTIIPFALVGYETGYSQLGATRLIGYLPSHIQCAHGIIVNHYHMTRTGPASAFIAKQLRKSPYEGRTRWREQGRKKPSGPARIAYGPHTEILSIARARCEQKQLCCCINPDFSVKKSDLSEHYEFDYPKIKKKTREKKKEKRDGHKIKCLLTELGRARQENIWLSFVAHGPRYAQSARHDLGPNIFPSRPPIQSIST